jgi:hypothetical protein
MLFHLWTYQAHFTPDLKEIIVTLYLKVIVACSRKAYHREKCIGHWATDNFLIPPPLKGLSHKIR